MCSHHPSLFLGPIHVIHVKRNPLYVTAIAIAYIDTTYNIAVEIFLSRNQQNLNRDSFRQTELEELCDWNIQLIQRNTWLKGNTIVRHQ